uniref:Galactose oxidase n=1 Tax=Davidia involucrata TaxID=16924 RepID=A0A5B7C108_DAVIN
MVSSMAAPVKFFLIFSLLFVCGSAFPFVFRGFGHLLDGNEGLQGLPVDNGFFSHHDPANQVDPNIDDNGGRKDDDDDVAKKQDREMDAGRKNDDDDDEEEYKKQYREMDSGRKNDDDEDESKKRDREMDAGVDNGGSKDDDDNGDESKKKNRERDPGQLKNQPGPEIIDGGLDNGSIGDDDNAGAAKPDFETNNVGVWQIHSPDSGVSAMHIQLLPNNKAIMFDATSLGPSNTMLPPPHPASCRPIPESKTNERDCSAHAVEYDIETAKFRSLKVLTDSWCSSGGLATDGTLVNTGGFKEGDKAVRLMSPCNNNCDWKENAAALSASRWYSTQQMLEDGTFVLVGGRRTFTYEIVPNALNFPIKAVDLPFLKETTDMYENNLYPFVYLSTDGNLFIFANNRSILLDLKTNKIVRELPALPGGSRNYPASGMSALLPLELSVEPKVDVDAEVIVCGGAPPESMQLAEKFNLLPALQDCARIVITKPDAKWEVEQMPSRRVMGDMLLLPTADALILNGATSGCSGWQLADGPNFTPLLYKPKKKSGERFKELKATNIPRMYHAASAVLPDGKILVAGSNTNPNYNFTNLAKFPTEMRVEKFSPPYLDQSLDQHRPQIQPNSDKDLTYGKRFNVQIQLQDTDVKAADIKVTMLAPPFTTHGFSQNQRLLVLGVAEATNKKVTAVAPPSARIATPGYYLLFVVHRGVPSAGIWVQLHA